MPVRLFDASHHNASAQFQVARAAGFAGAWLKATQGTGFIDPELATRIAAARDAGFPIGAYLFLSPDLDPAAQVGRFIAVVPADLELRVALDHETASAHGPAASAAAAVTAARMLRDHYGYDPLVYTYLSFAQAGHCAGLGSYPLWIADYETVGDYTKVGAPWGPAQHGMQPRIPAPWTSAVCWQIGQGAIPGVAGGDGPGTDENAAPALTAILAPQTIPPAPPSSGSGDDMTQVIRANGRVAAVLDQATLVAHPISSDKWSAVNHFAAAGLPTIIKTVDPADWDAVVPTQVKAPAGHFVGLHGEHIAADSYDPFVHDGRPVADARIT